MTEKLSQPAGRVLSRFVLEHLPEPVLVLDAEGHVIEENRSAREGERYSNLTEPFSRGKLSPNTIEFLDRLRATGHGRLALPHPTSAEDRPGVNLQGFAVDGCFVITLERDSKLTALEAEVRHFRRVETLGLVTARIVHDLNNLLMPLLLFSRDLASELEASGHSANLARDIESTAERAASLVKSVLAFARPQPLRVQPVSINSVVSSLRPLMDLMTGPEVKLVLSLDDRPLQLNVDRGLLEQAILNLVSNAKNAMPHGGELNLTTARASLGQQRGAQGRLSPHAVLIVHDTGVGMTEDVQRRAFDPFFTTRAASGGTGLGLTSVQSFVSESNGFVTVDSEAGRGTTVVIHLPLLEKEAPAASRMTH